jgi:hypothetical protein
MVPDNASSYSFDWIEDDDPRWDGDREEVFSTVSEDLFPSSFRVPGRRLPGTWWRLKDGATSVAHGWLHIVSGRAVALLAVDEASMLSGASGFGVIQLGREASGRGFGRVLEMRRRRHPQCAAVTVWILGREGVRLHGADGGHATSRRDGTPGAGR